MSDETRIVVKHHDVGGLGGALWFAGWLFTIGHLGLHMPQALYALAIWPYYIGVAMR